MFSEYTFLYVEDDPMSRQALSLVLTRVLKAKEVTIFEDSTNFMERVNALETQPDIIFLDIHVPPYNGFEMLKMLRAKPEFEKTPIIALTASVMNEEVTLLRSSGFSGAIGKPVNVANFPKLIQRVLNGETIWHITD